MKQVTRNEMRRELSLMPDGFADEQTVIDGTAYVAKPQPPPLPFSLMREKPADEAWILALGPAARAVLEQASMPARNWPFAGRVRGAVATPARRIPSL